MNVTQAPREVVLVGHCLPDASFLSISVSRALPGARITRANDDAAVEKAIESGALLLVNRKLEPGYSATDGNEYIRMLRAKFPQARLMLVSNLADAQSQAVADGALPGFGKDELGSPRLAEVLSAAFE